MSSISDVSVVRSIEAATQFLDGNIHYLAHPFASDDPLDFVWKPASFFHGRPSLVQAYWERRQATMKDVECQTSFRIFIPSPHRFEAHDCFANLSPKPATFSHEGTDSLSRRGIIARVIQYSSESKCFLVRLADTVQEEWIPEVRVQSEAPALVADYFISCLRDQRPQ
jgi:hypothetical protein